MTTSKKETKRTTRAAEERARQFRNLSYFYSRMDTLYGVLWANQNGHKPEIDDKWLAGKRDNPQNEWLRAFLVNNFTPEQIDAALVTLVRSVGKRTPPTIPEFCALVRDTNPDARRRQGPPQGDKPGIAHPAIVEVALATIRGELTEVEHHAARAALHKSLIAAGEIDPISKNWLNPVFDSA